MKAIVYYQYGPPDVLQYEETAKPTPGDDEVLIEVRAASANPYDWHFMRGEPYFLRVVAGLRKPKNPRLGADLSGVVEAVGQSVTQFKPGDAVFGVGKGAFAEYAVAPESKIVLKPANVTFESAAALPIAGFTALQGLRDGGRIQAGHKALINAAAGGVGTFAVQIAKSFGADVTGVCSAPNFEMVRSIGAGRVIDYTQQDFTRTGDHYDVILDAMSNHSLSEIRHILTPNGRYVPFGGESSRWMLGLVPRALSSVVLSRVGNQKLIPFFGAKVAQSDLAALGEMVEAGKITPVIDRRYKLNEVPKAIRYLEEGHARGKVLIEVGSA